MKLNDVKMEWERTHSEMQQHQKKFAELVKRSALTTATHERMNKKYFDLKAKMNRLVDLGKKMKEVAQ